MFAPLLMAGGATLSNASRPNNPCLPSGCLQMGNSPFLGSLRPRLLVCAALEKRGTSLGQAVFVHMFLADMVAFGEANKAYNPHMPAVNPPARACVQTHLPAENPVAIDVLVPCSPGVLAFTSCASSLPCSLNDQELDCPMRHDSGKGHGCHVHAL